jgi:hypothetical protein
MKVKRRLQSLPLDEFNARLLGRLNDVIVEFGAETKRAS